MHVHDSDISCGIIQLSSIGNEPTIQEYQIALGQYEYRCGSYAMIVASVTEKQKKAKRFLKACGFKKISKAIKNPNSGNMIALYVKKVSKKEHSDFLKSYKKTHNYI